MPKSRAAWDLLPFQRELNPAFFQFVQTGVFFNHQAWWLLFQLLGLLRFCNRKAIELGRLKKRAS